MKPGSCRHVLSVAGMICLAACVSPPVSDTVPAGDNVLSRKVMRAAMAGKVDFVRHVKPVLESKCVRCHNRQALPGYMSLENREQAKRTGALGSFIISGHPEHSLLLAKVEGGYPALSTMPERGRPVTPEEQAILTKWIKEGAAWPAGAAGTLQVNR
jgi:uncharacterized membrane protein